MATPYIYDQIKKDKAKKASTAPTLPKPPAPLPITKEEILKGGPLAINKAMKPIHDFNAQQQNQPPQTQQPLPKPNPNQNPAQPPATENKSLFSTESDKYGNPIFEKNSEAYSLANSQYKDPNAFAKELGLNTGPESIEDVVKQHKESQQKEADFQKQINEMEGSIENDTYRMEKAKAKSATSATAANFAQSREGVMGSSAPKIVQGFEERISKQMGIQKRAIDINTLKRKKAEEDLAEAQKRGDQQLAQSIMSDIASADQKIREAEARLGEISNESVSLSMKMEEQRANSKMAAFDVLAKSPAGSLSGQDPMAVAESFGVDAATASVLIAMDTKKVALEARQFEMDDADYAIKMSEIKENIANAKVAGMTNEQKNFQYYKEMMYDDPAGAEEFALATGIKEKSFFTDFQQQVEEADVVYEKKGVKVPIKSKYDYDVTPDGGLSFEKSAPAGKCIGKRSQCGEFVNDVINGGPGLMGDTFESKKAKVNSKFAVPGSAFVEKIGGVTGHTGIVEKTYDDGSFDIRESNYVRDEKGRPLISTAHIAVGSARWKTIVESGGFYVPGASQSKDVETGGVQKMPVEQAQNGLLKKYAAAFASGEYEIDELKAMGMSPSDIKMVTSLAFSMPKAGMDSVQIQNFAQQVANNKLSISDLKNMGLNENQLQQISLASSSMGGGEGNSARTTAEIILGSGGAMTVLNLPIEERAAVQAQINELQKNPAYKASTDSFASKAAQAIFSGNSTLTLNQLPQKTRVDVETELGKMRSEALKAGDIYGAMRASAGGGQVSDTAAQKFEKTANVIDQLQGLTSVLKDKKALKAVGVDSSPFWGWVQGKNPWSKEGQEISAQLQAIVPNLARGVYGEVGVLTDKDIELYRKTLPNLKQPEDIQKSITTLTLRSLRNSLENQIKIQSGLGNDLSGLVPFYSQIDETVRQMENDLGIKDPKNSSAASVKPTFEGTLAGLSALSAPFLGNKTYKPAAPVQQVSPWDDIDIDDPNDFLNNF